ncbi:MAG: hypothetical protein AAGF12_25995 [Myxococcota bacterium]
MINRDEAPADFAPLRAQHVERRDNAAPRPGFAKPLDVSLLHQAEFTEHAVGPLVAEAVCLHHEGLYFEAQLMTTVHGRNAMIGLVLIPTLREFIEPHLRFLAEVVIDGIRVWPINADLTPSTETG